MHWRKAGLPPCTGIADNLQHREQERRRDICLHSHILQIGGLIAPDGVKAWENEERAHGKPTGL